MISIRIMNLQNLRKTNLISSDTSENLYGRHPRQPDQNCIYAQHFRCWLSSLSAEAWADELVSCIQRSQGSPPPPPRCPRPWWSSSVVSSFSSLFSSSLYYGSFLGQLEEMDLVVFPLRNPSSPSPLTPIRCFPPASSAAVV